VTNHDQVKTFTSEDKPMLALTATGQLQAKTVRIGNDIIRVASLYVRGEIVKAIKKIREKAPSDISNEEFIKLCHANEEFEFWTTSLCRVEGEDPDVPWKYVLIDSPNANAFVSEILPQVSYARRPAEIRWSSDLFFRTHPWCFRGSSSQRRCSRITFQTRTS
jgi:hypothetical protein